MDIEVLKSKHQSKILNTTFGLPETLGNLRDSATEVTIEYTIGVLNDILNQPFMISDFDLKNKISELKQLLNG